MWHPVEGKPMALYLDQQLVKVLHGRRKRNVGSLGATVRNSLPKKRQVEHRLLIQNIVATLSGIEFLQYYSDHLWILCFGTEEQMQLEITYSVVTPYKTEIQQ